MYSKRGQSSLLTARNLAQKPGKGLRFPGLYPRQAIKHSGGRAEKRLQDFELGWRAFLKSYINACPGASWAADLPLRRKKIETLHDKATEHPSSQPKIRFTLAWIGRDFYVPQGNWSCVIPGRLPFVCAG